MTDNLLDEDIQKDYNLPGRRRKLLPFWIKFFCWIFMIGGAISPVVLVSGFFSVNSHLEIFGFETTNPLSGMGLLICAIFLAKGIVAYGLWFEKKWAVQAAMVDGFASIGLCLIQMVLITMNNSNFSFRFEILVLIPYLIKLRKIRDDWENRY